MYRQIAHPLPALIILAVLFACSAGDNQELPEARAADQAPPPGLLRDDRIREASGMVASRRNPGWLWVHNDSGDQPRLFAVDESGETLAELKLGGIHMRDWEDIAIGPGPEKGMPYLYIGEIGDNEAAFAQVVVYRLQEPDESAFDENHTLTINEFERFEFAYPNGPRDAETLLLDPLTGDLFILTKRLWPTEVYRAKAPLREGPPVTLENVAEINVAGIAAGDVSRDGRHVIIKSAYSVLHWYRPAGTAIPDLFSAKPDTLPYTREPQGEALAFNASITGYFTISEEVNGSEAAVSTYPFDPSEYSDSHHR